MTGLRASQISWSLICEVLGISLPNDALPVCVRCPLCGEPHLRLYQNSTSDDRWGHCFACKWSGDPFELAAAHWQLSPGAAIRMLTKRGIHINESYLTPEAIHEYLRAMPLRRIQIHEFWRQCRENLVNTRSEKILQLRSHFRLVAQCDIETWNKGPGKMLGSGCALEVQSFFYNNSRQRRTRFLFQGPGWRDVLITPSFTAPGQVCGFHYLGREGRPIDKCFGSAWPLSKGSGKKQEAGLAGLHSAEEAQLFRGLLFAMDDPWLMLRLQFRHFQSSSYPLPLVAWWDQDKYRTQDAWKSMADRQVVMLCRKLTPAVVYQAYLCDARLWLFPLRVHNQTMEHWYRDFQPPDLLKRAWKESLPWRELLTTWLPSQHPSFSDELFLGLEHYPLDVAALARECNLFAIEDILGTVKAREVRLGRTVYVERAGGWYRRTKEGKEVLVSSVIVRVEQIISGGKGRPRYRGRLLIGQESVRFDVAAFDFEHNSKQIVLKLCVANGLGRPKVEHIPVLDLALAFWQPEVHRISDPEASDLRQKREKPRSRTQKLTYALSVLRQPGHGQRTDLKKPT